MSATTDEQTARCTSVTSGDGRYTASGGWLGSGWIVVDHRDFNCVVRAYPAEPGLDAYGALQRFQQEQDEARRQADSE
jgi:hypothetical protein